MSDHIDGPRSIGEPAADVTDLFAFMSPENPARTVLAGCFFPSAGEHAIFSNVVDYSIAMRRVSVAGIGYQATFQPGDVEIRFSCRFDPLTRDAARNPIQRGVCTLPEGRKLAVIVNDARGAATPEGDFRIFAGLRSDPFYLAWISSELKKVPNLLQNDNVLCIVIELDTRRVLEPARGSLFGVIAETLPIPQPHAPVAHPVVRVDWVGRPEQTNIRLTNPGLAGATDLRDLWNQQTPFAIAKELQPLFLKRLKDSFANWDLRDGHADWTPDALAANAKVFLDDFLLIDVAKPVADDSHLEIEKSTLQGRPYLTGGGRTVAANVIDILLTWLVNHDREFLQGGATAATKPGTKEFPYFAIPNSEPQIVAERVQLAAAPERVWPLIADFGSDWHPLVARVRTVGDGIGQLRVLELLDGKEIVERLEAIDSAGRWVRYTNIAGVPASHYTATLEAKPQGTGTVVTWRVQFLANGQPDIVVKGLISTLLKNGIESLRARYGAMS